MASWDGAHVWLEFSGAPAELRPSGSSRVRWIDKIPTGNSEMAIIIRCPSGFEAGHFDAVQFQLTFDNTATFKWREKLLDFTRGKYLAGYKVTRLLLPVQGGLKSQKTMMRISKSSNFPQQSSRAPSVGSIKLQMCVGTVQAGTLKTRMQVTAPPNHPLKGFSHIRLERQNVSSRFDDAPDGVPVDGVPPDGVGFNTTQRPTGFEWRYDFHVPHVSMASLSLRQKDLETVPVTKPRNALWQPGFHKQTMPKSPTLHVHSIRLAAPSPEPAKVIKPEQGKSNDSKAMVLPAVNDSVTQAQQAQKPAAITQKRSFGDLKKAAAKALQKAKLESEIARLIREERVVEFRQKRHVLRGEETELKRKLKSLLSREPQEQEERLEYTRIVTRLADITHELQAIQLERDKITVASDKAKLQEQLWALEDDNGDTEEPPLKRPRT